MPAPILFLVYRIIINDPLCVVRLDGPLCKCFQVVDMPFQRNEGHFGGPPHGPPITGVIGGTPARAAFDREIDEDPVMLRRRDCTLDSIG